MGVCVNCRVCGAPYQLFSHTFSEPLCHRCLLWAVAVIAGAKARVRRKVCGAACGGPLCGGQFDGVGCA